MKITIEEALTLEHECHQHLPMHPKGAKGAGVISQQVSTLKVRRLVSGVAGWDRCVGGGIVRGTRVYLTGDPGAGKSTLLLLVAWHLAMGKRGLRKGIKVLYATAEEQKAEIEARFQNMRLPWTANLIVYATDSWEAVAAAIAQHQPDLIILDSLHTFQTTSVNGPTGEDPQVGRLLALSDDIVRRARWNPSMLIIGHINKQGDAAGRQRDVHHVTAHLHLSKNDQGLRVLRTKKNRHGAAGELGYFEFPPGNQRIREVIDLSDLLLSDAMGRTGVVAYAALPSERLARAMVVPIEAFVSPPKQASEPRVREQSGVPERSIENAVDRFIDCGIKLTDRTIRVQGPLVGDIQVADQSSQLAVCLALCLAHEGRGGSVGAFGTLAASGRVQPDPSVEQRLAAFAKANIETVFGPVLRDVIPPSGMTYHGVESLGDMILKVKGKVEPEQAKATTALET
jgi:DNA repair protein RadA/Sms